MLVHRSQTRQPGFGSITLLQKFTPHFKILDPRLAGSWAFESGIQLEEAGIPLTIGIPNQNLSSTDKKSGIHGVKSRIQDSYWILLHEVTLIPL